MKKSVTVDILKQHFDKKKKQNPGFSSRWLAQKLSISHAYISQIINGKRNLPSGILDELCDILDIDIEIKEVLALEILQHQGWGKTPEKSLRKIKKTAKPPQKKWVAVPKKDLNILENWYFMAILETTRTADYDGTIDHLAQRLKLEKANVRNAVNRLKQSGYLVEDQRGYLVKADSLLEFQSRHSKKEINAYHRQMLDKGKNLLKENSPEEEIKTRLITSACFTCSREQIAALRLKIAEFMKEMVVEASEQNPEEVYHFGVSFYPLTEVKK